MSMDEPAKTIVASGPRVLVGLPSPRVIRLQQGDTAADQRPAAVEILLVGDPLAEREAVPRDVADGNAAVAVGFHEVSVGREACKPAGLVMCPHELRIGSGHADRGRRRDQPARAGRRHLDFGGVPPPGSCRFS